MPLEMKPALSSMIDEIGYDAEAKELVVTFSTTGQTVAYEGVPQDVADSVINDPVSVGKAINAYIKPRYGFRYL